ncbi:MAG: DUF2461 domain-containing protein [Clostridia bacterium]|nr:DUF2461 domain-containing protein [Clostridia bacterium]
MTFTGITADSLFLLAENRFQDSKAFYEEHKPAINAGVVYPLRGLVEELTPAMLEIDPLLKGGVSRVRRDNRFTHDKSMYRENMWVVFARDKRAWNWCVPAFYLDFSLREADWGLGFYNATPDIMKCLRRRAEADPKRVKKAIRQANEAGFTLCGRPYARPRSTEDTPALLRPLYDCKSVDLNRTESVEMVKDSQLAVRLLEGFRQLAPMYALMMEAVEESCGLREV